MNSIVCLPLLFLLLACSQPKTDKEQTGSHPLDHYLPLKPGNYWVYQSYYVDDSGNGEPGFFNNGPAIIDSTWVAPDTVFAGHTWHVLIQAEDGTSSHYYPTYLRDSAYYIIDHLGNKLLGPEKDTSALYQLVMKHGQDHDDSAWIMTQRMAEPGKVIKVPAGTFSTIGYTITHTFHPHKASGKPVHNRTLTARFAPGIGLVSRSEPFLPNDPKYVEKRLLRYYVH